MSGCWLPAKMSHTLSRITSMSHPASSIQHTWYPYIAYTNFIFWFLLLFCLEFSHEKQIAFMVRFILAFALSHWQQYCGYEFQNVVRFCSSTCLPSMVYFIWCTSSYFEIYYLRVLSLLGLLNRGRKKQKKKSTTRKCDDTMLWMWFTMYSTAECF